MPLIYPTGLCLFRACSKKRGQPARISMYNYGSPRVGNMVFVQQFNQLVPVQKRVELQGCPVHGLLRTLTSWRQHRDGTRVRCARTRGACTMLGTWCAACRG